MGCSAERNKGGGAGLAPRRGTFAEQSTPLAGAGAEARTQDALARPLDPRLRGDDGLGVRG